MCTQGRRRPPPRTLGIRYFARFFYRLQEVSHCIQEALLERSGDPSRSIPSILSPLVYLRKSHLGKARRALSADCGQADHSVC